MTTVPQFANETKDNQKLVNSLVTRFDQPVTKDGKTHFSKTAYLNAEVAGLQSAMQKALKEQQDKAHSKVRVIIYHSFRAYDYLSSR